MSEESQGGTSFFKLIIAAILGALIPTVVAYFSISSANERISALEANDLSLAAITRQLSEQEGDAFRGPMGQAGAPGTAGPKGDAGPTGESGSAGSQGPVGPKGETGAAGPQGPAGPQGAAGAQGADGAKGEAGDSTSVDEVVAQVLAELRAKGILE